MKTLIIAAFLLGLFMHPALAVTLQVVDSNETYIEFNQGGTIFRVNLDTLRQGSDALRSVDLTDRVQTFAAVRQLRLELPLDDPDRMIDPGGPFAETGTAGLGMGEKLYWCDADGLPTPGDDVAATHMCGQSNIIEEAFWDGTKFILTIRVARDCFFRPEFPSCL